MSIDTIYASLNQLAASVEFLEQELARQEIELTEQKLAVRKEAEKAEAVMAEAKAMKTAKAKTLPQNDLFSDWGSPAKPANVNATASQLARKLDSAIENVQWLLQGKA